MPVCTSLTATKLNCTLFREVRAQMLWNVNLLEGLNPPPLPSRFLLGFRVGARHCHTLLCVPGQLCLTSLLSNNAPLSKAGEPFKRKEHAGFTLDNRGHQMFFSGLGLLVMTVTVKIQAEPERRVQTMLEHVYMVGRSNKHGV